MQVSSSLIDHVRAACVGFPDARRGDVRYRMAAIPTDNHIRAMLDPVHPSHLQPAFDGVLEALRRRYSRVPSRRLGGRAPVALRTGPNERSER